MSQPSAGIEQPRINRRQVAKIRTRQKVLDAARHLFAERGYEPATIRDIARDAGMSTGAVFANFQDKAELFETVLNEDMDRLAKTLEAARGEGRARDRLISALVAGYHETLDQLPLFQAIVARSWFQPLEVEKRAQASIRPILEVIASILREGVANSQLSQDIDMDLLTDMVWEAYLSNYRRAAYEGWGLEQLSAQITRQLDVILASSTCPE
jgi:AcrR family transcriptional regulator